MVESSEEPTLGIGAVARRTGLTPDVLRVWERRHGAVVPHRTEGGTRLYSETQVRRLEMLAALVARGHRIGRLAALEDDALAALFFEGESAGRIAEDMASSDEEGTSSRRLITLVIEALEKVDSAAVEQLLTPRFLSLGARRFTLEVAMPLLREVGERWAEGELTIAAEHAVVSVLRTLLGGAISRRPRGERSPRALFTTPAGQRHEFGALAAALLASGLGVDSIYLGPDLPAAEVAAASERTGAQIVVVGLAPGTLRGAEELEYLSELRAALPPAVGLWVGGEAASEAARELGLPAFATLDAFEQELVSHGTRAVARVNRD
ncbi:MAG: MerR family transcriptional regulator [Deltaproteobacteria bacterium]|nr:MerR family transcriptional regulator [Deltaproteobacteria bacterium]MBW2496759.1 MerR family transcriptional regulator [Deltaproteobacteria bacterium]